MDKQAAGRGRRRPEPKPVKATTIKVDHRIDLHIHDERAGSPAILRDILTSLGVLKQQGVVIMGKVEDQRVALERANVATNEIATDVRELIQKASDGALTQADVDRGLALATKLEAVAAEYTADATDPPADPPVEPSSRRR